MGGEIREPRAKEKEKYRLKKALKELKKKEGRGTELISLFIPSERRISDVIGNLREEYGTASNIKSDLTRKHVQDAVVKTIEKLKLVTETPKNGLIIFCGAIPQNGVGSEKMEIYSIVPPEPISINYYRCDSHFFLEPLKEMLKEKEVYGLVSIEINEAAVGILEGNRLKIVSTHSSGIPGKHRAGGQSARRFERLRRMEINEYFKRIARRVNDAFLDPEYQGRIEAVILGGPGFTKKDFSESGFLDYRIKEKIVGYIDTSYSGREGIRELVARAEDIFETSRYVQEKKIVDLFIEEASKKRGLATYGLRQTLNVLLRGVAETVIIVEDFKEKIVEEKCPSCSYNRIKVKKEEEKGKVCPSCGEHTLETEELNIFDYIDETAGSMGTNVEVINSKTEHGKIFIRFGGIGANLRY